MDNELIKYEVHLHKYNESDLSDSRVIWEFEAINEIELAEKLKGFHRSPYKAVRIKDGYEFYPIPLSIYKSTIRNIIAEIKKVRMALDKGVFVVSTSHGFINIDEMQEYIDEKVIELKKNIGIIRNHKTIMASRRTI